MLRQIKRIVPLSAAKMAAAIYGAMGVILGFPLAVATVLPTIIHARQTETGLSAPVISLRPCHYHPDILRVDWLHYRHHRRSDLQFGCSMARWIANRS
jgi:hypothetical protein